MNVEKAHTSYNVKQKKNCFQLSSSPSHPIGLNGCCVDIMKEWQKQNDDNNNSSSNSSNITIIVCHESTANEAFDKNETVLFVNVSNGDVQINK